MSRHYTPVDLPDVQRMWKECGWVDSDEEAALIAPFLEEGTVRVGEVDGTVESMASSHRGAMRYLDADVDAALVTAVTTSWVGRKRGLARRLTADVLADAAEAGAEVAALGIFEHGYYDRLGFGTGPYEHVVRFDPSMLEVDTTYRSPVRIGTDDHAEVAAALLRRKRSHGGIAINSSALVKAELGWMSPPFGLGYRDPSGRLTHFMFGEAKGEEGPYRIKLVSYETTKQLMELLVMLRSLGDQVRMVAMPEPPEVQLQDLVRYPFRAQTVTKGNDFEAGIRANAWWQARILDLNGCVSRISEGGTPLRFNLQLSDPLEALLEDGWRGIGGSYVIEIGPTSSAAPGVEDGLPSLDATVGAFTRLWLGVRPASSLAVTDRLAGSKELLSSLDDVFRSPPPRPGLYF